MRASEHFALNQWLCEYPDWSYDGILVELLQGHNKWVHEDITVWEVVEDYELSVIAEFIEDTRKAFERATSEVTA